METPQEFLRAIVRKNDKRLYDMFEYADDYDADVLDVALEEVRRRGLSAERASIKRACALQRAAEKPHSKFSAHSINGCGTRLLGQCDFHPDGSFVTTDR